DAFSQGRSLAVSGVVWRRIGAKSRPGYSRRLLPCRRLVISPQVFVLGVAVRDEGVVDRQGVPRMGLSRASYLIGAAPERASGANGNRAPRKIALDADRVRPRRERQ